MSKFVVGSDVTGNGIGERDGPDSPMVSTGVCEFKYEIVEGPLGSKTSAKLGVVGVDVGIRPCLP